MEEQCIHRISGSAAIQTFLEPPGFDHEGFYYEAYDSLAGIIKKPLRLSGRYAAEEDYRDIEEWNSMYFLSDRAREFVEPRAKDIEFHPVTIETARLPEDQQTMEYYKELPKGGGGVELSYWLAHSWQRLPLLDEAHSTVFRMPPPEQRTGLAGNFPQGKCWLQYNGNKLKITAMPEDSEFFGLLGLMGGGDG